MKIAILTSGILPVPAVQGGAVENLIDFCSYVYFLPSSSDSQVPAPAAKSLQLCPTL